MKNKKMAGANSTFAIGGVSCSKDSFVVRESSVLRMNFCAENPRPSQSGKTLPVILKTKHN